jgi:hypothetical protein
MAAGEKGSLLPATRYVEHQRRLSLQVGMQHARHASVHVHVCGNESGFAAAPKSHRELQLGA